MSCSAFGQDSAELRFEAASLKSLPPLAAGQPLPGPPFQGGPGTTDPERLIIRIPLKGLVWRAYGLQGFQVFGPDWMSSAMYEVVAKVPPGATAAQVNLMLQNLLAERLELKLHHETRTLQVNVLTVDQAGLKMKLWSDASIRPSAKDGRNVPDPAGFAPLPSWQESGVVGMLRDGHLRLTGYRATITQLISFLDLDHPILDQTGLTGEYDFRLDFVTPRASLANDAEPGPGIFSALPDQLGLRLKEQKEPMDVVVIDHAGREPSPN
jgi:uncharacterized protein (TIGR03435 family)